MKKLIKEINASPYKAFITVTGGGTGFIADFLELGGGSQTILGFYVPYTQKLFDDFVGHKVDKYVSEQASRELAVASYLKAREVKEIGDICIGLGVTCSIATDNEREGREHKIYMTAHCKGKTISLTRILQQGRQRCHEESVIIREMYLILAEQFTMMEHVEYDYGGLDNIRDGEIREYKTALYNKRKVTKPTKLVFPGSFNPLHRGHLKMAELAETVVGIKPTFELCIDVVDKYCIDELTIHDRLEQFVGNNVVVTDCSYFRDKAKHFGDGTTFVVGVDTFKRVARDLKDDEIKQYQDANIKFMVFSRDGESVEMFPNDETSIVIPINDFNEAISSTQIRENK